MHTFIVQNPRSQLCVYMHITALLLLCGQLCALYYPDRLAAAADLGWLAPAPCCTCTHPHAHIKVAKSYHLLPLPVCSRLCTGAPTTCRQATQQVKPSAAPTPAVLSASMPVCMRGCAGVQPESTSRPCPPPRCPPHAGRFIWGLGGTRRRRQRPSAPAVSWRHAGVTQAHAARHAGLEGEGSPSGVLPISTGWNSPLL